MGSRRARHPAGSRRCGQYSSRKSTVGPAGSRLAIHGYLEFVSTILGVDPVSTRVGQFNGVRSLIDVRSLGRSAILRDEAAGGPFSDLSANAIPKSPARFRGEVIVLDFDHNVVLGTTPHSVLKLRVTDMKDLFRTFTPFWTKGEVPTNI
jgi:hypothetical protein